MLVILGESFARTGWDFFIQGMSERQAVTLCQCIPNCGTLQEIYDDIAPQVATPSWVLKTRSIAVWDRGFSESLLPRIQGQNLPLNTHHVRVLGALVKAADAASLPQLYSDLFAHYMGLALGMLAQGCGEDMTETQHEYAKILRLLTEKGPHTCRPIVERGLGLLPDIGSPFIQLLRRAVPAAGNQGTGAPDCHP